MLSETTIYDFEDFTGYDITTYINNYLSFMANDLVNFISFYKGQIDHIAISSKKLFDNLLTQSQEITDLLKNQLNNFVRCDFANLSEMLDNIRFDLFKTKSLGKFLRSSLINEYATPNILVNKIVTNYETPESIEQSTDTQNKWVDTYVSQRIYEQSFDKDNGYLVKQQQNNFNSFDIQNIVDYSIGDTLLGRDINKTIQFNSDLSDLVILDGYDTAIQGIDINSKLFIGANPLYSNVGIDPTLLFGNLIGFNLPFIIKQLTQTFNLDQSLTDFTIENILPDKQTININISVKTVYGKILETNLNLEGTLS